MPVQIQIESAVTLAQLAQFKQDGYMVEETPHIGNLAISTLALLSLGIEPNLVDATIGEKDNLFYPHCIIINGVNTPIAPAHLMTTHNKVSGTGMSLSEFHTQPLKEMGFQAHSHSQWLEKKSDLALKVIVAVTNNASVVMWKRHVTVDGAVTLKPPPSSSQLLKEIHKVTTAYNESGWIIPNPINILLDLVSGALETEKESVYMLSGQSMYRYIQKGYGHFGPMNELISRMYDSVRNKSLKQLPKTLTVKMVPTPVIRHFVSPAKLKSALDNKLRYYEKARQGNARCGRKKSEKIISAQLMTYLHKKRNGILNRLSQDLSQTCAASETGSFYSQHDLAKNQDTVYIPDQVLDMPFSTMMNMADRLCKIGK